MSAVASKNLYELLGNNPEEDSDREPEPPVKVVDKTPARTIKRNATGEAPAPKAGTGPSTRRGGFSGNEGAYRDRTAGSSSNRGKSTEERGAPRSRGARGGRGATRRDGRDDRHSKTATNDTEKQTSQGWGAVEGGAEFNDEKAGEQIAKEDQAIANAEDAAALDEEPKDNSISYTEYLAQLAEKKLNLGAILPSVRKANEGTKEDKKWSGAKAIEREEEDDFIAGSGGKAKRERERKQKQTVDIDHGFIEQPDRSSGGGRGGRGGRGRGEGRGGRGRGEGRGGPRGGRGGRDGPGPSAPSSGSKGPAINTSDKSAFPSLGA